jgi:hypothetical protein
MRPVTIKTSVPEIYMKLPSLNFVDEVIFSARVPDRALKKIVRTLNSSGGDFEIVDVGTRKALIKRRSVGFNTYLLNKRVK